ncbi:hypothetical protein [Nocardia sp. NPDC049707]|uniref:hypothetical protein n=1 Tax=Nocardia sp. NPDC049707 TaxID=3154735 RepID=UPI003412F452
MTALLPLAYGYVRDELLRDCDRNSSDDRLRAAARSLGYALGGVFHEPASETATLPPAFVDLVQECRRAEAHTVLTLPGHLSGMSVCRMVLLAILDVRADAAIHRRSSAKLRHTCPSEVGSIGECAVERGEERVFAGVLAGLDGQLLDDVAHRGALVRERAGEEQHAVVDIFGWPP